MAAESTCPECGALGVAGREGCQALFDRLCLPGNLETAVVRDLAFDAYCMQHPERYCRSAKSYAAHLTRLCCGVEHAGEPAVYAAIQRWLNGSVPLEKPDRLPALGRLTVADLRGADSPAALPERIRVWAQAVWAAYAPQQSLARAWLELARARR